MIGRLLGPYRLEAELGSGGMGTVYRAVVEGRAPGLAVGKQVAVKVVHPHLLSRQGFFKRFLREGEIGGRVRHENVVATIDIDATEVDGASVLFMAMEYVEGRTLRELLRDLGQVPEGLLRELARQTAAGLSAIHAAGIVHRDLKPENVLVTDDQRVCIMDLGVARLVEASIALTPTGLFAGSVLYAAPEQFRHEGIDTAADLYALGAVLYELAAGTSPFQRDDMAGIIHAHLHETPPPLRERARGVSPFLSEVVATLLAKDVHERIASATELAQILEAGENSPWWAEREQTLLAAGPPRPEVLVRRHTRLHGREEDLKLLAEGWAAARAGEGNTLLLEGEAGIGKTRLVDAFFDSLEREDAHVLYGAYFPHGGLGAFSEAILAQFGTRRLEEALGPFLHDTPGLVAGFAALVRREHLPTGAQPLEGDALHAVMVNLVRALAADKPVLWVVEDLHFAPPESRALFLSLARAVTGHRAFVVGTTRPGIPEDELSLLTRLETCRRHVLQRLSPREVMELLRDAFQSPLLADRLGGRIAFKSDGVPFFVFEMVGGLRESGHLSREADGTWVETRVIEDIEVPSAVRDLVEGRLTDLDRRDRGILDVAAVQGFEFDADLVARVLEMKRIPVLQALAEVERRSGLVRAAGRLIRFDHHQVQEVLYAGLPEALRVEYHTALAEARVERDGVASGEACEFVADHFLRGARPELALPHLERALEHLMASYRSEALVDLAGRVLGLEGFVEGELRISLLQQMAAGLGLLGRREEQEGVLLTRRRLAEETGSRSLCADALVELGWFQIRVARYGEAVQTLTEALQLARAADRPELETTARLNLGVALIYRSRLDEADEQLQAALTVARACHDRRSEALALGSLGNVLRLRGRRDEALQNHMRHREIAHEIGDLKAEITALGNIGNVLTYAHDYEAAEEKYTQALELARRIGDRHQEATLLGNLAGSLQSQDLFIAALDLYDRAVRLSREIDNRQGEAYALMNLGNIQCYLGDLPGAADLLEAALEVAEAIDDGRLVAHVTYRLAEADQMRGDRVGARCRAEAAERLRENSLPTGENGAARTLLGDLHLEAGEIAAARARYP